MLLAAAAPSLIAKVEKAHDDEVFWDGLRKRTAWLSASPRRLMGLIGALSAIGWGVLAIVNVWHLLHQ